VTTLERLFSSRTFDEFDLPDSVRAGLADAGFTRCTLVQAEVLPPALAGRDVAAQAQTGTGKTAAYLVTIFTRLLDNPDHEGRPRALIVAPTRELAVQIHADAVQLGAHTGFKAEAVFGGMDYRAQRDELARGVDLLVGTPGRLLDYLRQGVASLKDVEVFVVDEADRMFDMGFIDDLREISRRLPRPGRRQTMFFTATMSTRVSELGWREMRDPVDILVNPEEITPDRLSQKLYHVGGREKFSLLLGLLAREGCDRTMVFVNTRHEARRLVERLERHGYTVRALTGSVIQTRRLKVLKDFKEGTLPILVATDVASRGLHIEGVTHVINYDLPEDPEDYVHRVGRTARAGAAGKAISLACENFIYSLSSIERLLGASIPVEFAEEDLFVREQRPANRDRDRSGQSPGRDRRREAKPRQSSPEATPEAASGEAATAPRKRRRRRRPSGKGSAAGIAGEAETPSQGSGSGQEPQEN
jgi:ATP-dependent RNA helicase RhlB